MAKQYTPEFIREIVTNDIDRLFEPWRANRPETWIPDSVTKILVATGYWLTEELKRICKSDADVRTQQGSYNRLSRTYDVYEIAAAVLNEVIDDSVEQNRRGHRRWG